MRNLRILGAFITRDWAIARSYVLPFWLEAGGLVLTTAMMFYLSRLFGDSPRLREGSAPVADYFAFVIVGLACLQILSAGMASVPLRIRGEQAAGTLEHLLASQAPAWVVALGTSAYEILKGAALVVLQLVVAVAVFGLSVHAGPLDLLAAVLAVTALAFAATGLGVAIAAFAIIYKNPTPVLALATTGLALISGTFFPGALLPEPLELLGRASPLNWATEVARSAVAGANVPWRELGGLIAVAAVALPGALALFGAAVVRAKREGSLAQY